METIPRHPSVTAPQPPEKIRSGLLTILYRVSATSWQCRCACGAELKIPTDDLRRAQRIIHGALGHHLPERPPRALRLKHLGEYRVWIALWNRCRSRRTRNFKNYGGRGIDVDPRWVSFAVFLEDMGSRPLGLTIERADVDGHYTKSNCRWATRKEQARNQRRTVFVEYQGQQVRLADLLDSHPDPALVRGRLALGWDITRALTKKKRRVKRLKLEHHGRREKLSKLAEENGVSYSLAASRLKRGWSASDILFKPALQRSPKRAMPLSWERAMFLLVEHRYALPPPKYFTTCRVGKTKLYIKQHILEQMLARGLVERGMRGEYRLPTTKNLLHPTTLPDITRDQHHKWQEK